jgi:hypothetical protein
MSRTLAWSSLVLVLTACGGPDVAAPTERLWISTVPTSAKQEISAFVTTRSRDDRFIGAFFHGSALRGHHDVFSWVADGRDAAKLTFLQDGKTQKVRFESCKPSRGFDYCLIVHGDPTGARQYQSRKRWSVRRPGKRALELVSVPETLAVLAEDDDELAAALVLEAPDEIPATDDP